MPVPAGSTPPAPPLVGPIVYDPVLSRVRLSIDSLPAGADVVHIQRSTDSVVWTTVRGGLTVPVVAGVVALDDYEFTPGVLNHYRVQLRTTLNANPFFETDAANWSTLTGTFVRFTEHWHEGAASGLLNADGVSAESSVGSELVAATPGGRYFVRPWVRCTATRDVRVGFNWYDAGSTLIGGAETSVPVVAHAWTLAPFNAYAPPRTAFVQHKFELTGPTTDQLIIDEARLTGPAETSLFTGSILVSLDGVWLKSLSDPALNRKVTVRDWSPIRRPSRAGVFDVLNTAEPIAVGRVRGSRRWALDVRAGDPAEAAAINALLDGGGVLLLHVPAGSTVPGGYVTVGDSDEVHYPHDVPKIRTLRLPMTVVAAPPPDVVGVSVP